MSDSASSSDDLTDSGAWEQLVQDALAKRSETRSMIVRPWRVYMIVAAATALVAVFAIWRAEVSSRRLRERQDEAMELFNGFVGAQVRLADENKRLKKDLEEARRQSKDLHAKSQVITKRLEHTQRIITHVVEELEKLQDKADHRWVVSELRKKADQKTTTKALLDADKLLKTTDADLRKRLKAKADDEEIRKLLKEKASDEEIRKLLKEKASDAEIRKLLKEKADAEEIRKLLADGKADAEKIRKLGDEVAELRKVIDAVERMQKEQQQRQSPLQEDPSRPPEEPPP